MEPENWPLDPDLGASRVVELIEEIAARTEQEQRTLLEMFLSASWGCRRALDQ
jgi:hypothetical protein